jgi:hypothetical protein
MTGHQPGPDVWLRHEAELQLPLGGWLCDDTHLLWPADNVVVLFNDASPLRPLDGGEGRILKPGAAIRQLTPQCLFVMILEDMRQHGRKPTFSATSPLRIDCAACAQTLRKHESCIVM